MLLDEVAIRRYRSYAAKKGPCPAGKNLIQCHLEGYTELRKGTPAENTNLIGKLLTGTRLEGDPSPRPSKTNNPRNSNNTPSKNPASQCDNCTGEMSLGKLGCELGKLSCEFTTSVKGTANWGQSGVNKMIIPIVVAGVIIIAILVVMKKR